MTKMFDESVVAIYVIICKRSNQTNYDMSKSVNVIFVL